MRNIDLIRDTASAAQGHWRPVLFRGSEKKENLINPRCDTGIFNITCVYCWAFSLIWSDSLLQGFFF
ncbi:hypothetical protein Dd1591_2457 [Dickeya chrysanthemi Ech1591]|uniref:Uncharacterized protein n=1 Tax=Dickeya chrysanthemi (strain Ech1591) TaxID=561229 RepID=C6CL49_DICC1|nr:hypothetical protein Dd1591_2457 [Dickeya chrysanthemi Ech1591]